MTWISFVVVSLVIYFPIVGIAQFLAEPFNVSMFDSSIAIPFGGSLRLLLSSLLLWSVLTWVLHLIDETGTNIISLPLNQLRKNIIYSNYPAVSNNLSTILAFIVLTISCVNTVLWLIHSPVQKLFPLDQELVVYSIFNLVVAVYFRMERISQFEKDLELGKKRRKYLQVGILTAGGQARMTIDQRFRHP